MPSKATRSTAANANEEKLATLTDIHEIVNKLKTDLLESLKDDIRRVECRINSIETRIANVELSLTNFYNIQQKQQNEINEIKSSMNNFKSEILDEIADRESRRNKLIVFGIPEHDSGSVLERKDKDEITIRDIFKTLGFDTTDFDDAHRVGKIVTGKVRPLKFSLRSTKEKDSILRKAKLLKNHDRFKRVFISSDKTKRQQDEWRELRKELIDRRNSGEDVVIYDGKVCQRSSLKDFRS